MAERQIEIRIENGHAARAWLDAHAASRGRQIRDFVEDTAHWSAYWMHIYAPIGESLYLQRHIEVGTLRWHPGGAGGGGWWEMTAGVRRGTSEHPLYVHSGTGIYAGRGPIRARHDRGRASVIERRTSRRRYGDSGKTKGPMLTFQKRGEPRRFRPYVLGQRPQPFVYMSFLQAQLYARTRIRGVIRGV